MCALMVSRGRQANPVLTYTTALRRFYFGATAEKWQFYGKNGKMLFFIRKKWLFDKNYFHIFFEMIIFAA